MPTCAFMIMLLLTITTPLPAMSAVDKPLQTRTERQNPVPGESAQTVPEMRGTEKTAVKPKPGSNDRVSPREPSNSLIVNLSLFLVMGIAALLLVRAVIRAVRFMSMSGLTKMRHEKFNVLSPLVIRSLENMATPLWGENHAWLRKYHIKKKRDRWILCDRKRDGFIRSQSEKNSVEISLRDTNFRVNIILLNGMRKNVIMECRDFSESELVTSLEKVKSVIMITPNSTSQQKGP